MFQPLNSHEAKSIFFQLYKAKNAHEVKRIIEKDDFLSDNFNWKPFNGTVQNFASFQNQSADPLSALVEKQNNQYDAILEKMCIERGIDPTSPLAPNSVKEAVQTFFGVDITDWHSIDPMTLREIAENIQIIADGDKATPNLTFYDDGIGQSPLQFERSFLSINAGNKAKKRFVQGKFNMGGLGSQEFCGGGRYQLIASKSMLHPTDGLGFTLVRFHELSAEEEKTHRSPWYEYFCPGEEIASFDAETLDLDLENRLFTTGTIIKLYSYELTNGLGGDFLDKFYKELNQAMFMPPMPLLLSERRYRPKRVEKGEHVQVFLGNHNRILLQPQDVDQSFAFALDVEPYGELSVSGFVFKEQVKYTEYGNNMPVILTLNGQTQGSRERGFISQELGFKYLRDSLIIHIDCTGSRRNYDIFMGSRDRTKRNRSMLQLWEQLIFRLKKENVLQQANLARLDKRSPANMDNHVVLDKIWKSVTTNSRLTDLLRRGGYGLSSHVPGTFVSPKKQTNGSVGKRTTAIVPLSENGMSKKKKSIPLGNTGIFHFESSGAAWTPDDLANFQLKLVHHRNPADEKAEEKTVIAGTTSASRAEELFEVKKKVEGNMLKVQLRTKQEILAVGDEVWLSAELSRESTVLTSVLEIKIGEPQKEKERKQKKAAHPTTPELLRVCETLEDGDASWSDYDWNQEDVVQINVDQEGLIRSIAVNMDSRALTNQLLEKKLKEASREEASFLYMANIYFNSLYMYLSLLNTKNQEETFDVEERVSQMFKSTFGEFLTSYSAASLIEV